CILCNSVGVRPFGHSETSTLYSIERPAVPGFWDLCPNVGFQRCADAIQQGSRLSAQALIFPHPNPWFRGDPSRDSITPSCRAYFLFSLFKFISQPCARVQALSTFIACT